MSGIIYGLKQSYDVEVSGGSQDAYLASRAVLGAAHKGRGGAHRAIGLLLMTPSQHLRSVALRLSSHAFQGLRGGG